MSRDHDPCLFTVPEIFHEVMRIGIEPGFSAVRAAAESAPPGASHRERLSSAIGAHPVSALECGPYTQVNIRYGGQLGGSGRVKNPELRGPYHFLLAQPDQSRHRRRRVPRGPRPDAVQAVHVRIDDWAVHWYRPDRFSLDEIVVAYTRMLLDGLLPAAQPAALRVRCA